jgi:MerR family transcriptional regulator, Zn(II)-responsive regulator of zntA
VKRIHYYERRGLLEPARRSEVGYRIYGAEEVARLEFVKRVRLLGPTLEEIRQPVSLAADCNEDEIVPRLEEVLSEKLEETERKIAELSAFRENLRGQELLRVPGGRDRREGGEHEDGR